MRKANYQSGFTAVELLVTLFVAAAFLMSGYQLYAMIIKNNGEASARAKAVSVAYQYLQQYKTDASAASLIKSPCTIPTPNPNVISPTIEGLSGVSISISISCHPATTSISKLTVTVNYNYSGAIQQVTNSTYANK
jgi:prepilin-type N-terminal cleavage/methylation domain-containing protein